MTLQGITMARALARALNDRGVGIVTAVPGHGATQTFDAYREVSGDDIPYSYHEEAAFAVAHGAALCGSRSACLMKAHGLAKSMNAVLDALSCGVTAGMVTLIFEDKTGAHSDNVIEIEPIVRAAELPYKRSRAATAYADVMAAFQSSARLQLPFTLIFDAAEINDGAPVGTAEPSPEPLYQRDVMRHVVCPLFAGYQREVLRAKLDRTDTAMNVPRPEMPMLPESLPPSYQEAVRPYLPLFSAFRDLAVDFVCGDAGVSTLSALPPYHIAHAALYMGGSIPTATGAWLAGKKRSWAFIGDFSFIAAGHYGLIEAIQRNAPIKVLIFVNGRAQTTGGQPIDVLLLARLLRSYDQYLVQIDDPTDPEQTLPVLQEVNATNDMRIIIANFTE